MSDWLLLAAPLRLVPPLPLPGGRSPAPHEPHGAIGKGPRTVPPAPACRVDLEVIKRSGTAREVWLVERVEPVLARPHFLLATLLLCNSAAMEALPLFLDRLLNPAAAIILSGEAAAAAGQQQPVHPAACGRLCRFFIRSSPASCSSL